VELAAYRVVQEALANARRHASGAAVDVELRYGDTTMNLLIRDNGPGPPAGSALGWPRANGPCENAQLRSVAR
jgi:signal transduction histidine kinase